LIYLGQIGPDTEDDNSAIRDPLKLGRARLIVPAFGASKLTDWAWRLQLPGVYFGPSPGMNVLVLSVYSKPRHTLFWLGPIDAAPGGASTTPRADEYSVSELPKQKIMDFGFAELIADFSGQQLFISTRPPDDPARITFDANLPQLQIFTGATDAFINAEGDRLAMVGDTVIVDINSGVGQIVSGSVPVQSRFVF